MIQLDGWILLFIQEHIRREWMDGFWIFVTHLGDKGWIWILLGLGLLLFPRMRKTGAAVLLALLIGALLTNVILKNLVARVRPYEVVEGLRLLIERQRDFSFPSGHTCASFAGAFAIYRAFPDRYGKAAIALAILISLSRLYVGVHYPTDVLAGMAVGIFSGWAAWYILSALRRDRCST